jgi:hypothetical protein
MVGRHVSLEAIVPGTEPDVRVRRCGRLLWARGYSEIFHGPSSSHFSRLAVLVKAKNGRFFWEAMAQSHVRNGLAFALLVPIFSFLTFASRTPDLLTRGLDSRFYKWNQRRYPAWRPAGEGRADNTLRDALTTKAA